MKEHQKEVEIIRNAIEILSSLLLETDTDIFVTPIDKLGQLVSNVGEQMKSLEDVAYVSVEKYYKKKREQHLVKDIDKGKVAITVNKDYLKEALETGGKILSSVSKFSYFCAYLKKKKEAEQELEVLSESSKPLKHSVSNFGRLVVELQHKLKAYESEQVKRIKSQQELHTTNTEGGNLAESL